MRFVLSTATKMYLIIALIASISSVVITFFFLEAKRELLIENKQLQLVKIAATLERKVDNHFFAEEIARINALPLSRDEKAFISNQCLQPIVMDVAESFPGYGVGVYAKPLERIVAIGPEFNSNWLRTAKRSEEIPVYETKQPYFCQMSNSIGWHGKAIFNLAYPIIDHGVIIGHTWASTKVEDVENEIRKDWMVIIVYAFVISCILLTILRLLFKNLENSLKRMALFVKNPTDKDQLIRDFPEMQPLLEEIGNLRFTLEGEYQKREQVNGEMARLERLNLVGEMAAGIGHEVRNPMTTVRGYLQYFQGKAQFADHKEQFGTMIEELDRANAIITEFLALAKDKAIHIQRGNINTVVQSLLMLLQVDAFSMGHTIQADINEVADCDFDEKEIRQLILNMVHNSFEAMEQRGKVYLRTYQDNDRIVLAIKDTGAGISADVINKLGTPFVTTKVNGTGLGLPICYRIAARHGAEIRVETGPQGTTFTVRFPAVAVRDDKPANQEE
jgi:signal transduction histidine kinase